MQRDLSGRFHGLGLDSRLDIRVTKAQHDAIQEHAARHGMTMSRYILGLIREDMMAEAEVEMAQLMEEMEREEAEREMEIMQEMEEIDLD